MFTLRKSVSAPSKLDETIENLLSDMAGYEVHSEEYTKACENLKVLYEAKASLPKPESVSPDTFANVVANLVGIVAILGYEKKNIITSKALSFVTKTKL